MNFEKSISGLILPYFTTCYRAIIVKANYYWYKEMYME